MRTILLFILLITLSGCASMNNQFDCPRTAGVMCKSLDEVNAMVDNGSIETHSSTVNKTKPIQTPILGNISYARQPLRQQEQVLRIWVAPYEDTAGNYHQDATVFKVVKPSTWQVVSKDGK